MKKNFTLIFSLCLLFLGFSNAAKGQTFILSEDFASITTGNNTSTSSPATTWAGNANFPTAVTAFEAGGAIRLGSSKSTGSITSKSLDLSVNGGAFKVKLKVKGWSSIEGSIKITAGSLPSQTLSYTAKMADAFEEIEAEFTGGTANSTVKIETTSKRAFIDEVTVYYGGSELSNDATLSSVNINGTPFADFDPAKVSYYVTLTSNTVPVLAPTTNHANATNSIVNASAVPGKSEITVTAENGTTQRIYAFNWSYQPAEGEKGSKTNPYTIAEAQGNQLPTGTTTKYWVKGYIVGAMTSSDAVYPTTVVSNIVIADAAEADITNSSVILPVELPTGTVRAALNLVDNAGNYKAEVAVFGTLETYFSIAGVKSTSDYQILSTVGISKNQIDGAKVFAKNGAVVIEANDVSAASVYSLSGKLLATKSIVGGSTTFSLERGAYIVKVGNKITKVIL